MLSKKPPTIMAGSPTKAAIESDVTPSGEVTMDFDDDTLRGEEKHVSSWRLLLKQDKIVEALLSADKGRAQALDDLMKCKHASEHNQGES